MLEVRLLSQDFWTQKPSCGDPQVQASFWQ